MRDKVQLSIRIFFIVTLAALASGCSVDRPLKQPNPSPTIAPPSTSENSHSALQCDGGVNSTPKKMSLLHIGMSHPEESQHFPRFQALFTKRLLKKIQFENRQYFRDASHISLKPQQVSLLGKASKDMKKQIIEIGKQFDSQIIVSGTISRIKVTPDSDPNKPILSNISTVIDGLSGMSERKVFVKFQLFDSYSGDILNTTETEHSISIKSDAPFFLLGSSFNQHQYEERLIESIDTLVNKQLEIINDVALCATLKGRIASTDNISATINVGAQSQVNVGDQFKLIQSRLIHTDAEGVEHLVENEVGTLIITKVQPESASGQIENLLHSAEIQKGDLVISR